jgi:hypothetical protein
MILNYAQQNLFVVSRLAISALAFSQQEIGNFPQWQGYPGIFHALGAYIGFLFGMRGREGFHA